jgi:hypothetical protein
MTNAERMSGITVLATLKNAPVLIWIAAALFLLAAPVIWEGNPEGSLFYNVFGDAVVPMIMASAVIATASFIQMYRWRDAYLRHDAVKLYRGWWDSWPITAITHVYITTNWLGIRSLRARIGARDIELFKAYFAVEDVEEVLDKLKLLARP